MDEQEKKGPRHPSLRGAARRVLGAGAGERPLPRTREVLAGLLDSSDKVKTEAVRALGREVRSYLEGLGMDEALMHLFTNYSLEVNASFSLKPLSASPAPTDEEQQQEPGAESDVSAAGVRWESVPDPELGAGDEAQAVVDDDAADAEGGEGVDDDVD